MTETSTKFKVPPVGSIITITTRYHEIIHHATNKWRENTYVNVEVLPREKWLNPNQFIIPSDDPRLPFRVININNVVDLSDGERVVSDTSLQTVTVEGSKGKVYKVTIENGSATSCTCPGFQFRHHCRHLKEAENQVDRETENADSVDTVNGSLRSKTS